MVKTTRVLKGIQWSTMIVLILVSVLMLLIASNVIHVSIDFKSDIWVLSIQIILCHLPAFSCYTFLGRNSSDQIQMKITTEESRTLQKFHQYCLEQSGSLYACIKSCKSVGRCMTKKKRDVILMQPLLNTVTFVN